MSQLIELEKNEDYYNALSSVTNNGITLRRVLPEFQANETIVLAAVSQNGNALQYACDELKGFIGILSHELQIICQCHSFSLHLCDITL